MLQTTTSTTATMSHPRIVDFTHAERGPDGRIHERTIHWEASYGWGTLPAERIRKLCQAKVAYATDEATRAPRARRQTQLRDATDPLSTIHVRSGDPHPDEPAHDDGWTLEAAAAATHPPYLSVTIECNPAGRGQAGSYMITHDAHVDVRRDPRIAALVAAHRLIDAAFVLAHAELAAVTRRCHGDPTGGELVANDPER